MSETVGLVAGDDAEVAGSARKRTRNRLKRQVSIWTAVAVALSACHKADTSPPDAGESRVPAFYGTRFGMTPEEVAAVIPLKLTTCADQLAAAKRAGTAPSFEVSISCGVDGFVADDKVWERRLSVRFVNGLQFNDESFDATFEFVDGRLYSVRATFEFGGYQSPLSHVQSLGDALESRFAAAMGPGVFEADKDDPDAGGTTFKAVGRQVYVRRNRVPPPSVTLNVFDTVVRDQYDREKKARDQAAVQ